MNNEHISKTTKRNKHITREERFFIENMLNSDCEKKDIAKILGRHISTIYREINRGLVIHKRSNLTEYVTYSADRACIECAKNQANRYMPSKVKKETVCYISEKIIEKHRSPDVIWSDMVKEGYPDIVCTKTIYNWIDAGYIPGVTNDNLWEKHKRNKKGKTKKVAKISIPMGKSIEDRPFSKDDRTEFGHWEIDLVLGGLKGSKKVLLTLTERKTRYEITVVLPNKKKLSVKKAMNKIEREYGAETFKKIFKTITADNGTEFRDYRGLERSVFNRKEKRTTMYYAHPYSSWERGSNENCNRLIRRFVDKGSDINDYTVLEIKECEDWINNYPRKIIGYKSALEYFKSELLAA
jgi:transposase, IS30 family